MLQQTKRLCDAQRTDSSQKHLRGSVVQWSRAEADPLIMSRCSHMADGFPEGTERKRGVSVENADSDRGTGDRIGTAPRGSNRTVAISDDHELRLDDDRAQK